MNELGIEDICTLSPMQEGMLFHTLLAPASGTYFQQFACTLEGTLDVGAFGAAWARALERHAILRTTFLWEKLEQPHQIVHRSTHSPLNVLDWRGIPGPDQEARWQQMLRRDRVQGFQISQAPPLRVVLARTGATSHRFAWSYHHLLLDNASEFLLLQEVGALYRALSAGRAPRLPSSRPYRDYVAWLKRQDLGPAEAFWRRQLDAFAAPTPLAGDRAPQSAPRGEEGVTVEVTTVPPATANALGVLAKKRGLTMNTIVQGAWALVLSHFSGKRDVLFGSTHQSGFPATLGTRERILGLFINTLPTRVRLPDDADLPSWLRTLQDEQLGRSQFDFAPLAKIQCWAPIPRGKALFESLLVVENYRLETAMESFGKELRSRDGELVQQSNYPLMVTIHVGSALALSISYDHRRFARSTIRTHLDLLGVLFALFVKEPERDLRYFLNALEGYEKVHAVLSVQRRKEANQMHFGDIRRAPVQMTSRDER